MASKPALLGNVFATDLWAIRADMSLEELTAKFAAAQEAAAAGAEVWAAPLPSTKDRVAVVPVEGVLTKNGPRWWGSNYNGITKAVTDAAADPDVSHIVLAVDSPGGEVGGCIEAASAIAAAAKQKPVTAMVDGMAASAAYWLTSQANSIVVTPSGSVGSVGIKTMHIDVSGALEQAGIKVTELQAGDHKTEWSRYKPLAPEAAAEVQQKMDTTHQQFITAVTQGRGGRASRDIRIARFGEGRMFSAQQAIGNGLADKIQSAREFYASLLPAKPSVSKPGSLPYRLELDRAKVDMAL